MPATLTGLVFNDVNHNGQFTPGEPGIPGVYLVLFNSSNGTCTTVLSDQIGNYSFTVTTAGTYVVYEPVAFPGASCPPTTFTQPPGFTLSNGPRKLTVTVTATQIANDAIISNLNFSHDTISNPVVCSTSLIQFAGRPSVWYDIDVVTGSETIRTTVNPPLEINAIGYNPLDDYIYGYDQLTNHLVRVDNNGNVMTLFPLPPGMAADAFNTGTFDPNGFLYVFVNNESVFYVIDLRPNSSTFLKLVNPANGYQETTSGIALSRPLNASDWVYRAQDGHLYGITPAGVVKRIDPFSGHIDNLPTSPLNPGPFGALAIDSTGIIYAISNSDGTIYRYTIEGFAATAARFSTTVTTSFNDGTMCPNAAIELDFGDAPDFGPGNGPGNYSTLLENDGPRHGLVNPLFLGTQVTPDPDARQNPDATGDDIPAGIQDDALPLPLKPLSPNEGIYHLDVLVTNQTGTEANLYGWIDFNQDGIFQVHEAAFLQKVPSLPGPFFVPLDFPVPPFFELVPGQTFLRLRLTTDDLPLLDPSAFAEDSRSLGPASDGEVEDYPLFILQAGGIQVFKRAEPAAALPGEPITYIFTVENPNPFDLTNVRIEDSLLGLIDIISVLPAGSVIELHSIFVIPPDTPAGTFIKNIVVVFSDQTEPVESATDVEVLAFFELSIVKSADRVSAAPGETVEYTLSVTNKSNAPITNVRVSDVLVGFFDVIPFLEAGETRVFVVDFTIPEGTLAGTVFTNTTVAESDQTEPASDSATVVVSPVPSILIFKNVSPNIAAPGEVVEYTITITNAGNQTLTNVHLTDPTLGLDNTFDFLEPGDSVIFTTPFTVPQTSHQGDSIVNVALVTTSESGPSQADAVVTVIGQPGISISKSVSPARAKPGTSLTYTFTVSNTGNTILTNVILEDELLGLSQSIGTLEVNETRFIEHVFTLPPDTVSALVNTAMVTGTFEPEVVTDSAQASVEPLLPAIALTKTVSRETANPGETVFFTFVLTNAGEASLTNLNLSDSLLSYFQFVGELLPGASVSETIPFIVPEDASAGTVFANLITATSNELEPQTAEADVTVNAVPAIAIAKSADRASALPGDTITYAITVSNIGNTALTNVTVRDELLGLDTVIPSLAVGETRSLTAAFVVPADAIVGSVIRNSSTAFSDQTDTVEDSSHVLVSSDTPLLTITKAASVSVAAPGDTVFYTITVANQGTAIVTNVVVTDVTVGFAEQIGVLTPGESRTFTVPFVIPADAANGSVIVNTSVASSDQTDPVQDSAEVAVDPQPGLSVTKTINPAQAAPGETVIASIVATNTGNAILTNVVVADDSLNFRTVIPALPIGESFTVNLPIEAPFAEAGTVISNTVTASSAQTGETSSTDSFTVLPAFEISLVKQVDRPTAAPGETVTFTFELRNLSNATITDLHLVDELLGLDKRVDFLPPGFFIQLSRTFRIPDGALGGSIVNNTVVLTTGETSPVTSTAEVTVQSVPRLSIEKTVFPPLAFPGETVFFHLRGTNTGNVALSNIRYSDPLLGPTGIVLFQTIGETIELVLPFVVPNDAIPGSEIVNTVFVDSQQTGPLTATTALKVATLPMTVIKRADVDLLFVGDQIIFTITAANVSNLVLHDIVLTDSLPEGTQFVPLSVKIGGNPVPSANPSNGIPLGNLAPGQNAVVTFAAKQIASAPNDLLRNQASVSFRPGERLRRFAVRSNVLEIPVEEHVE
ncbi:SdrD B-like domain-containing protein [Cohnella sp. AR92]|uniref:DUF7507 domain-containing protein n=1 Tax=Cohnella sp. AR92 TaxID=648716 RepID=UPI000F8D23CD|nr:SdrD B-like domain-containing protein [Cohnella sp. AR92]RUS47898.1 DUF11 domain-containing protein [Cohnella sp. AR92]